jgi:2-desacetyl-2-hydroxyethyl bacteriochlorophyllide A dehydrogenase
VTPSIPTTAPSLVVPAIERIELADRPVGIPGPGQVLVRTEFSGVSVGTEMGAATGKHQIWGPMPYAPGYQSVGTIAAFGEGDHAGFELGDHVAVFSTNGTHAAYVVADLELTHRVEVTGTYEENALFVAPSVGMNAVNKARLVSGATVLVVGQGLIGQATAKLARLRGAYVVAADISPERLAVSAGHCADRVIDTSGTTPWELLRGDFPDGFDYVIESTGYGPLVETALECVRFEGMFVFEGQYPGQLSFTYQIAHQKQIDAVFPWFIGPRPTREAVLRLISSGAFDYAPLISHRVSWRDAVEVYGKLFTPERDHLGGIVIDWRDAV